MVATVFLALLMLRNSMDLKPFRHVKSFVQNGSDIFFQGEVFEEGEEDL